MKIALERKVRDAELMAHRLMHDTEERRNRENHYCSQIIPMNQVLLFDCYFVKI